MMPITLYIYRKGERTHEVLGLPDGQRVSLSLFGLVNALLGSIRQVERKAMLVEQNQAVVQEILGRFVGRFGLPLRETPVSFLGGAFARAKPLWLAFAFEFWLLELAGILWLFPGPGRQRTGRERERPSERYVQIYQKLPSPLDLDAALAQTIAELVARAQAYYEGSRRRVGEADFKRHFEKDPNLPAEVRDYLDLLQASERIMLLEAVNHRQEQLAVRFVAKEIETVTRRSGDNLRQVVERYIPARCYISRAGLLPLCWAEVLYAVESDTFARTCDVCKKWFPLQKRQVGQQKYCSSSCRDEAKRRAIARKRQGRKVQ